MVRETDAVPLRRLNPRIPADLETICLKCLEKEPRRRYATALELAEDLDRYLKDEPIRARPVRAWEHGWKWVRRNPWRAALAGATAMMLVALTGLGLAVTRNSELTAANAESLRQKERAETEKGKAENAQAEAEKLRAQAQAAADREKEARATAEDALEKLEAAYSAAQKSGAEARLLYYASQIPRAWEAWDANRLAEARSLLDLCPEEHRRWEWHYLNRLSRTGLREVTRIGGASNGLSRAVISVDGQRVAAGSTNRAAWLLEVPDSKPMALAPSEALPFSGPLAFAVRSPWVGVGAVDHDSTGLAIVGFGRTPDVRRMEVGISKAVGLAFAEGDELLLAVGPAGLVAFDTGNGTERWRIEAPVGDDGLSVAAAPTGGLMAWITGPRPERGPYLHGGERWGNAIHLVETATGRALRTLPTGKAAVHTLAFGPNSRVIVSGHEDGLVTLWDVENGMRKSTFRHGYGTIHAVAFTADGSRVITGSSDGTVGVIGMTGAEESTVQSYRGHEGSVLDVRPVPGRPEVLSVGADGTMRRWAIDRPQDGLTVRVSGSTLAFLDDERLLLDDRSILSATTGERLLSGPTERIQGRVAIAGRGGWIAVGSTVRNQSATSEMWSPVGRDRWPYACTFSHDGRHFAVGGQRGRERKLQVLAVPSWEEVATISFNAQTNFVFDAAFTPDDRFLALALGQYSSATPGEVQLWDWQGGQVTARFPAKRFCVLGVAVSRDGRRLASAGGYFWWGGGSGPAPPEPRGEIDVWDMASGERLFDLTGVPDSVATIAFSPDGSRLAAAVGISPTSTESGRRVTGRPGVVKIWEMERGQEILTLGGFPGPVTGVAFSPNGRRIAAIGSGVLRVFDAGPIDESSTDRGVDKESVR